MKCRLKPCFQTALFYILLKYLNLRHSKHACVRTAHTLRQAVWNLIVQTALFYTLFNPFLNYPHSESACVRTAHTLRQAVCNLIIQTALFYALFNPFLNHPHSEYARRTHATQLSGIANDGLTPIHPIPTPPKPGKNRQKTADNKKRNIRLTKFAKSDKIRQPLIRANMTIAGKTPYIVALIELNYL